MADRWLGLRRAIRCLPTTPGVYRFCDARHRTVYLGRAASLRARVGSYWTDLEDRSHLAPMLRLVTQVEVVQCDSEHEAWWLERNLLECELPRWNRTAGGQEVPTYVVLHRTASGVRAAVTASPRPVGQAEVFGPYLGATRVRAAVAGLERVLPLGFTEIAGDRSVRELAAARGMRAADSAELSRTVASVLRGDPVVEATIRASLVNCRDKAVARLSFEVAGHVQRELEGLAWITSAQKVTKPDSADLEAHGWSDGVLVTFVMRQGRVIRWQQERRRDPPAVPAPGLSDEWREFAHRNAVLAARLMRAHQP